MMRIEADLTRSGDLLKSVRFKHGSQGRPLWARMERLLPFEMIMWVDRFDSLCPIASERALARAVETSADIDIDKRMEFVRTLLCELNRLVWLTTYLGRVTDALGQCTLTQQVLVLRESVLVMQEEITGGRILPQAFKIGGVRRDFAMGDVRKVRTFLSAWKLSWESWVKLIEGDPLLESRLHGLMIIPPTVVEKLAWWGVVGKGSGVDYDSRRHRPHGAYPFLDFELISRSEADALARFEVVIDEVGLTLKLLDQVLRDIPDKGTGSPESVIPISLKPGIFFGTAESAKGPVIATVEVAGNDFVSAVRLLATGQRVWPVLEPLFKDIRAEDFELAFASLGVDTEEAEI